MIAEPKRKPHQDDNDRDKRERRHQEEALDEALKNTFPASDPVSVEQPAVRRRPRQGKDLKDDERARGAILERTSRRSSLISDPIRSPGVFPRPSAAKFQVLQIRASLAMTRCRPASVPLDSE